MVEMNETRRVSYWRSAPLGWKILIIAAGVVVLAALVLGIWWLVNRASAPVKIAKLELTNALSSRQVNAEVKSDFAAGDPVMLYFEYDQAEVGTSIRFELRRRDSEEVLRSGATPVLRKTTDDPATGQRHISLVNTGNTVLAAGQYEATLFVGEKKLETIRFNIN